MILQKFVAFALATASTLAHPGETSKAPDIFGLKPGMSLADIKQAIARHHPGFLEANPPRENFAAYVGIPRTLAVWSAGKPRTWAYRVDADEEYFEAALTLPPSDPKAFAISRMVCYAESSAPAFGSMVDAIIKHYGEPSYQTSDNNRYLLYWGYDNNWEPRRDLDSRIKAGISVIPSDAQSFLGSPSLPTIDTLSIDSVNYQFNSYFGKVLYVVLRTDHLRPNGIRGSKGVEVVRTLVFKQVDYPMAWASFSRTLYTSLAAGAKKEKKLEIRAEDNLQGQ